MKLEIYNKPFSFTQVYFEMWVDFTLQSIMELITALIKTAWVGLAWKLFYKATVEHFYALLWLPVVELTLVHVTSWQSRSILCVTSQFFGASNMLHVFGGLKSLVNLSQQVSTFSKTFSLWLFWSMINDSVSCIVCPLCLEILKTWIQDLFDVATTSAY